MEDAKLVVRFGERVVARLLTDGDRFGLSYDPGWLSGTDAFAISLSLPLREAPHEGGAAHWFFSNLLPEGAVREAVCARLGISVDNDLALLRAIGGECAGALSITEPEQSPAASDDDAYELLDDRRLQRMLETDVVPLLIGGAPTRLSLAGAQDKLPVAIFEDRIHLPLAGAPSTHILKLPNRRYAHLPLNEAFVMGLSARIGLETAAVDVVTRTDPPSLLVERFDRRLVGASKVVRLHQEDLCQALGLPPKRKYEQEGGPSLVSVLHTIRDHVQQPVVDVGRLIAWQAFNVVVGNCDGHAKNLALLYDQHGLRLAPFYDVLSTRHYPALDRRMAMSVGGRREPTELHRAQWEQFARDAGIGPRVVLDTVRTVAEQTLESIPAWIKEYRGLYGRRAILETLPAWITKSARKVLRNVPA